MSSTFKLLEIHAKEKLGDSVPPEWRAYKWKRFPENGNNEMIYQEMTGVVAPDVTRGKRKGEPNWRKEDKSTRRAVVITVEEHKIWCEEWEKKRGLCHHCVGDGEVFKSWSRDGGTVAVECPRCHGTGKNPNMIMVE